jgi:hypothetical protein
MKGVVDVQEEFLMMKKQTMKANAAEIVAALLVASLCLGVSEANSIRSSRRGAVAVGEEGKGAAVGRRGAVVKGEEGYAAVGRRGAVVSGEEGYAAVNRRGGAVVAGEEGVAAVGRHGGVVVGNRYEDYEAWRAVAGVGAAIAIGTMLARPPSGAVTMTVGGSSYWYSNNTYYTRVYSGGNVAYQVCGPPAGAIIRTLPAGCATARVGAVSYQRCGSTYYQRVGSGYQVVVLH